MIATLEEHALKEYKWEDEVLWISNYVARARIKTEYKVNSLLHHEVSPYQEISIVDTKGFGRMLVLDGVPQISSGEGFIYNEMISHNPNHYSSRSESSWDDWWRGLWPSS